MDKLDIPSIMPFDFEASIFRSEVVPAPSDPPNEAHVGYSPPSEASNNAPSEAPNHQEKRRKDEFPRYDDRYASTSAAPPPLDPAPAQTKRRTP
ncbi:hypothetical protein GUJ93_ZPchr0009g670 [Zizania palustris]|uniref:Uncharacterized protein n=1 Tax=Zizania palustris TaxID=103762 RepID=A0A8J5RYF3_ZIZPA|nr:hypothetical protein GUJ93_ZPchr0009g670 [Zizania palustris]